jgi:hypothetical protein
VAIVLSVLRLLASDYTFGHCIFCPSIDGLITEHVCKSLTKTFVMIFWWANYNDDNYTRHGLLIAEDELINDDNYTRHGLLITEDDYMYVIYSEKIY